MSMTIDTLPQHFVSVAIDGHTGTAYCLSTEENVEYVLQLAADGHDIKRITKNVLVDGNADIPSSSAFVVYLEDIKLPQVLDELRQQTAQFSYLKSMQTALEAGGKPSVRAEALAFLENNRTPERENFALTHLLLSRKLDAGHDVALAVIEVCRQQGFVETQDLLESSLRAHPHINHVHAVFKAVVSEHVQTGERHRLIVDGLFVNATLGLANNNFASLDVMVESLSKNDALKHIASKLQIFSHRVRHTNLDKSRPRPDTTQLVVE